MGIHSEEHDVKMYNHTLRISELGSVLKQTNDRISNVAGNVQKLRMYVKPIEGRMRGELQSRLSNVRAVLLSALDKAGKDISEIKKNVENGLV